MISPARVAAYEILRAISSGTADLPTAIAFTRAGVSDERDRALAAEIASGVQRWRAALDHLIGQFAKRPIDRLDPEVVEILRLSAYQLLHLTRVPAAAVVDDAVDLTKKAGKRSASGFVNAVLRSISRRKHALPLPQRPADPGDREAALDYLSITLSHPRWLAGRWLERLGLDAAEAWMQFDNTPGPVTLRANRLRTTREELRERLAADDIVVHPTRYAPDGLVVDEGHPLRGHGQEQGCVRRAGRGVAAGDAARRRSAAAAGPRHVRIPGRQDDGDRRRRWKGAASIVACDVRDRRVDLLRRTVARQRRAQRPHRAGGPAAAAALRRDLRLRARRRAVLRAWHAAARSRHPLAPARGRSGSARRRRVRRCSQHAADTVAPGGRLIYATCSSEPEENEGIVAAFSTTTRGFHAAACERGGAAGSGAHRSPRAPPHAAASPRSRGVLRRRIHPSEVVARPGCRTDRSFMALRTRVWSAGKLAAPRRRAARHLRRCSRPRRCASRCARAKCGCPTSRTGRRTKPPRVAASLGLGMKIDESRRPDPKIPAGHVARPGTAPGSIARRQRSIKVWLSAGARSATMPPLLGETERTAQLRLHAGRPELGRRLGNPLAGLRRRRRSSRRRRRPRARPAGSAAGQPRRARRQLRDAGSDRRQRRSRRRHPAQARLSRRRGRLTPYPGVPAGIVIRQSPQAGFQIAPGEPISLEVSR